MSIIGIFASEKHVRQIKKEIEEQNLNVEIICINSKSIENLKNVKFEILVIQKSPEKLNEKKQHLKLILKNSKYVLLNTDISIDEESFKDVETKILTYGLKQKSTVTASSMGEKQIIISIQRAFKDLEGKVIEQQEIPIKMIKSNAKDVYNSLIRIAIINVLNEQKC